MFEKEKFTVLEERSSRKNPLSEEDGKQLIAKITTLIIAKGKSSRELSPKDATVNDLKGPTGKIRAPLVRIGKTLLVGFHASSLQNLLKTP